MDARQLGEVDLVQYRFVAEEIGLGVAGPVEARPQPRATAARPGRATSGVRTTGLSGAGGSGHDAGAN